MKTVRCTAFVLPIVFLVGALMAPSAQAAETPAGLAAAGSPAQLPAKGSCHKNVGVGGFGMVAGKRIENGRVRVYVRGVNDRLGEFSKRVNVHGSARTNKMGGFAVTVDCIPASFKVKISDGRVGRKKNTQTVAALGRWNERGVIVNPATSVAVAYAERKHVKAKVAAARTKRFLRVVDLGDDVVHFGSATWVRAATFSPARFYAQAMKAGGVGKFAKQLAKQISKSRHHSFRPKGYVMSARPGFPKTGSDGSPRMSVKRPRAGALRGGPTSILYSVAGKAAFNATCALLPPSPPTNLACASPASSQDTEIENQLTAVSDQLAALQTSVNDIQSTLSAMSTQLEQIENTLDEIVQQNSDALQVQLQAAANTAQQQYQDAYGFAGIIHIQSQVVDANTDLSFLGTITPSTSWVPVTPGSSNATMCATMYSDLNTANGYNPLAICTDFLSQTQAFANPTTTFFQTLYTSLVGAPGLPQDDLLLWTYQQMLTYGASTPIPADTLAQVQANAGQLGALMDNSYALLAAAQVFEYGATTGLQTSCPELTTSGTFPATTSITVADACSTLETGLFAASVQNSQGGSVAVPPAGSVADPRTNYVWWSYPVDLTASTASSGGYPFWPGAPSGTYTTGAGNPLSLWEYTTAYNPACCKSSWLYASANPNTPVPALLPASPSYNFTLAQQAQNQTLFSNLLLTDSNSVAGTLADSGFEGIGTKGYGMQWTNLGADPQITLFLSTNQWQSTTPMPSDAAPCTGFPATQTGSFKCSPEQYYDYESGSYVNVPGESAVTAIMAAHTWNLDVSQLPDASTLATCPDVGTASVYPSTVVNQVGACESNTFGLMVDTAAGTAGTGVLPPFSTPSMFNGPNPAGVPAGSVPPPTPVSSSA